MRSWSLVLILFMAFACDRKPGPTGEGMDYDSVAQLHGAEVREQPPGESGQPGPRDDHPVVTPNKGEIPLPKIDPIAAGMMETGQPTNGMPPQEQNEPERRKPENRLGHMLDRVWGIRLPDAAPGRSITSVIGEPPYILSVKDEVPEQLPDLLPREILIVVSRREIIVNNMKVADVLSLDGGEGSPAYTVGKSEGEVDIEALTRQVTQFNNWRSTLLRLAGLPLELAESCDLATLMIDGEIPFSLVTGVVHSAGLADVYRFRLGARGPDEVITYLVLSAPRLTPGDLKRFHVIGDDWWKNHEKCTADFEFAFVNYIASSVGDAWTGEADGDLPTCMPGGMSSFGDLTGDRLESLRAGLKTVAETSRSGNRPGANGDLVPFVFVRTDGAFLVLMDMADGTARRSEFYTPEEIDKMVASLAGHLPGPGPLFIGAEPQITLSRLVATAGRFRRRCVVESMSGRCVETRDWRSTLYLFRAGPRGFEPLPAPPVESPPDDSQPKADVERPENEGETEKGNPEPVPEEQPPAPCSLKEVSPILDVLKPELAACIPPASRKAAIVMGGMWTTAGPMELLSAEPPLPESAIRCLKGSLNKVEPLKGMTAACKFDLKLSFGDETEKQVD